MSDPNRRRSFREIYREQYRQVRSSRASRVGTIAGPVFLIAAIFHPFGRLIGLAMLVIAVVLLALAMIIGMRSRHR